MGLDLDMEAKLQRKGLLWLLLDSQRYSRIIIMITGSSGHPPKATQNPEPFVKHLRDSVIGEFGNRKRSQSGLRKVKHDNQNT